MQTAIGGHDDIEPIEHQAEKSDPGQEAAAKGSPFHDHKQRQQTKPGHAGQVRTGKRQSQQQTGKKRPTVSRIDRQAPPVFQHQDSVSSFSGIGLTRTLRKVRSSHSTTVMTKPLAVICSSCRGTRPSKSTSQPPTVSNFSLGIDTLK